MRVGLGFTDHATEPESPSGVGTVRFVVSLWTLILASLALFTVLLFSHDMLSLDLPPLYLKVGLLAGAWTIGIASAAAIHVLYSRTEAIARRSERDRTVVEIAGAVAHEMNQPLTVVISTAELMCLHDRSPEDTKRLAIRMVDASQRMSDIVERLQRATHYSSKEYVAGIQIVDLDKVG